MDLRFLGGIVALLIVVSGGAVIAVLTFGQVLMVVAFVGSVIAAIVRRFPSDEGSGRDKPE